MKRTQSVVVSILMGAAVTFLGCTQTPPPAPNTPTPATRPTTAATTPAATPAAATPGASGAPGPSGAAVDTSKLPGVEKWKGKKNPVPNDAAALAKGKEIFIKNCATCHGESGKGDGPAGTTLDPKPRDFTNPEFKYGSEDWNLARTIMEGAPPPSGMVGWSTRMSEQDAWTVIHYVRSLKGK